MKKQTSKSTGRESDRPGRKCEESLERKKTERKVWITEGTWEKIEERKSTKEKLNSAKNKANLNEKCI